MILIDSNILLRSHPSAALYSTVKQALAKLTAQSQVLCVAPQNLLGFWAVATRPLRENGWGMDGATAEKELLTLRRLFKLLPYTMEVLDTWQRIVITQRISGK